jgi:chromosome segregation ATPase
MFMDDSLLPTRANNATHAMNAHAAAPPGHSDDARRIAQLERQVAHLADLHERAESRLQRLLDSPGDVKAFKDKLRDPDIAVPLLHAYDLEIDTLKDKASLLLTENLSLKADNEALREALDRARSGRDGNVARQVADEREHVRSEEDLLRIKRLEKANDELLADFKTAQAELSRLREAASSSFVANSRQRDDEHRNESRVHELEQDRARLLAQASDLEVRLAKATKALQSFRQHDEDEQAASEAQRIQLQLLQQENDDKMQELDRLRAKMLQALHQAGDNHNTHLKIIEEKHAEALRGAREEARVHEVAAAKLRAQINRLELVPSYSGSNALAGSPTAAIEFQARHAQDLELKRLYTELASAQLQRDDAVARLEHVSSQRRSESDERVRELSRSLESGQMRVRELEERCERLEAELDRSRELLSGARADCNRAVQDRSRADREASDALRSLEDARRAKQAALASQEAAEKLADEQVEREKRTARALERRLEGLKHDAASQKDRMTAELEQHQRTINDLRTAAKDYQQRAEALTQTLADKERAHDALVGKCDRLLHGLEAHKHQLSQCDERLLHMGQRETALAQELRAAHLAIEQLRMDAARLTKDRDRMASEGQALSQQLEKYVRYSRRMAAAGSP